MRSKFAYSEARRAYGDSRAQQRQSMVHGSISLNLARLLVKTRLGANVAVCICTPVHLDSALPDVAACRLRNESILPGRPDVFVLGNVRTYFTRAQMLSAVSTLPKAGIPVNLMPFVTIRIASYLPT
jgi:hypothetical protein